MSRNVKSRSEDHGSDRRSSTQAHSDPVDRTSDSARRAISPGKSYWSPDHAEPQPIPHAGIRTGEIIAYRCWWVIPTNGALEAFQPFRDLHVDTKAILNPPLLVSVAHNHVWHPGIVETGDVDAWVGGAGKSHLSIPGGIYAFDQHDQCVLQAYTMAKVGVAFCTKTRGIALGRVKLWGEVIQHEYGYRASHAKVHSIHSLYDNECGIDIDRLRRAYGVMGKERDADYSSL